MDIFKKTSKEGTVTLVDPAMADNGSLYSIFDMDYVNAMKNLCKQADYILPNITEACFLTGTEYRTEYDREYIDTLLSKFVDLGCKNVVLTGVSYGEETTGVVVYEQGEYRYYEHPLLPNSCHGTGDIYASAFVGAFVRGNSAYEAAKIAAEYTMECIKITADIPNHWYGAAFEPALPKLIDLLK